MLGSRGRVQGTSRIGARMYAESAGMTSTKLQEAIRSDIRAGRVGSRQHTRSTRCGRRGADEEVRRPLGGAVCFPCTCQCAAIHVGRVLLTADVTAYPDHRALQFLLKLPDCPPLNRRGTLIKISCTRMHFSVNVLLSSVGLLSECPQEVLAPIQMKQGFPPSC